MRRRSSLSAAAAAACLAGGLASTGTAQARGALFPGCVNGPLYVPYVTDRYLGNEVDILCGVFGNKPHNVTIELRAAGNYRTARTAMWFPGQYPWVLANDGIRGITWGAPNDPRKYDSCVTVSPFDTKQWWQKCQTLTTYKQLNGTVAFVRGTPRYSEGVYK